ncbi:hypothetical protein KQX54_015306 [Cotesia glomerata]|uniref:Uncharacterized protein n=1 Tax=Cotesia glomerata TaxID=32391 RepID=A0AAV7HVN3_COTGL|nr:hypothetical protein KQX54_015306 [Cotesia glomerata]
MTRLSCPSTSSGKVGRSPRFHRCVGCKRLPGYHEGANGSIPGLSRLAYSYNDWHPPSFGWAHITLAHPVVRRAAGFVQPPATRAIDLLPGTKQLERPWLVEAT